MHPSAPLREYPSLRSGVALSGADGLFYFRNPAHRVRATSVTFPIASSFTISARLPPNRSAKRIASKGAQTFTSLSKYTYTSRERHFFPLEVLTHIASAGERPLRHLSKRAAHQSNAR